MRLIADLAALCVAISIGYYIVASLAALRFAIRVSSPAPPLPETIPRVAILKPLNGLTANLREKIVSYLELDYPRIEYYFGVSDSRDRAAEVPTSLHDCYPQKQITLVVGAEPGCPNRKVAKLIAMAERAPDADIFVMSDADIAVDRDHLRRLVGELAADVKTGVISCIYRARPSGSLASRLEALVGQHRLYSDGDAVGGGRAGALCARRYYRNQARRARANRRLSRDQGFPRRRFPHRQTRCRAQLGHRPFQLDRDHGHSRTDLHRLLEPPTALGTHLSHDASAQSRDDHHARPFLGARTVARFGRQFFRGRIVWPHDRGTTRDVHVDVAQRLARCRS